MKSFKYLILPAIAYLAIGQAALAQPVYRCGNSYSQTPCAGAVTVQADDTRTDAQRAAAREGLARDKALGNAMEATRRKDEAQVRARDKAVLAANAKAAALAKSDAKKLEHEKAKEKKAEDKKRAGGKKGSRIATDLDVFTVVVAGTNAKPKKPKKSGLN
jgi:hypothetical protein